MSLRLSAYANGVSELHGEVAREMWASLEGVDTEIGHVTNGVHLGTWLEPALPQLLLDAGIDPVGAADRDAVGQGARARRRRALARARRGEVAPRRG